MYRLVGGVLLLLFATGLPFQFAGASEDYKLLELDGRDVKWGNPEFGTGATLTYAVAVAAPRTAGTRNCTRISGVDPLLKRSGLSKADVQTALDTAIGMWERVADVQFVPARREAEADVLVVAESVPDGIAYTDLATRIRNQGEPSLIRRGIICLNPELPWSAGGTNTAQAGVPYNLTRVLAHEIGHVLGLDHPGPRGEMMSFEYDPALTRLQAGDISGIEYLYGRKALIAGRSINIKTAAR